MEITHPKTSKISADNLTLVLFLILVTENDGNEEFSPSVWEENMFDDDIM